MGKGVHEGVHGNTVSVAGKLIGILLEVHPLIRIAEVGIVIDHDYETPLVVPDAFALRGESILFVRDTAVVKVRQAWNLLQAIHVKELMKDRVVQWDIPDFSIWHYFFQLGRHVAPFETSPEVIEHPETAAIEVLAHDLRVLG